MAKVFLSISPEAEELLGFVNGEGEALLSYQGQEQYVGRVDLATGKVFQARFGPDDYIGHVALDTGKVYRRRHLLPDHQLGSVQPDGALFRCVAGQPDAQVGHLEGMAALAHGGAALLLLVLPALDEPDREGQA